MLSNAHTARVSVDRYLQSLEARNATDRRSLAESQLNPRIIHAILMRAQDGQVGWLSIGEEHGVQFTHANEDELRSQGRLPFWGADALIFAVESPSSILDLVT